MRLQNLSLNQLACPLCHQNNACGLNKINNKVCWCESITLVEKTPNVTDELGVIKGTKVNLAELEKSQSCICQKCLNMLNSLIKEL